MSHNGRLAFKKKLAAKLEKFYNQCHGEDGRFCEEHGVYHGDQGQPTGNDLYMEGRRKKAQGIGKIQRRADPYPEFDEEEDPWGEYASKEELEKHEGMSARTWAKTMGKAYKKFPSTHGMSQKEFVEQSGRWMKNPAHGHPITQKEFVEATGRWMKNPRNDRPITQKEWIEATGRYLKDASDDHPMTEGEFRKAMGYASKSPVTGKKSY